MRADQSHHLVLVASDFRFGVVTLSIARVALRETTKHPAGTRPFASRLPRPLEIPRCFGALEVATVENASRRGAATVVSAGNEPALDVRVPNRLDELANGLCGPSAA